MKRRIKLLFVLILFSSAHFQANGTSNQLLSISASCAGISDCVFDKKDIPIDISIKNISEFDVYFPLQFIEAQGPAMMLIDKETKKKMPLRTNLPPNELRNIFITISPGEVKHISTIIKAAEITIFRNELIDLVVELALSTKAEIDRNARKEVAIRADTSFRIVGKDTLKLTNRTPLIKQ